MSCSLWKWKKVLQGINIEIKRLFLFVFFAAVSANSVKNMTMIC